MAAYENGESSDIEYESSEESSNNRDTYDDLAGIGPSRLSFSIERKEFKAKRRKIQKVLDSIPVSSKALKKLAISQNGLIDDSLRKTAWPLILDLKNLIPTPAPSEDEIKAHPEYEQVILDVNRCINRFPPGIPLEQRLKLQDQLTILILRVLQAHPRLNYYQGYHDVAITLLLVTGENAAFFMLEHLSLFYFKDCMEPTMEKTSYLLNYIYPLVKYQNKKVYAHLEQSGVGTMFALPWFLTWFSHNLNRYSDLVRLYDFFLSCEPLTPLYLSAVIIVHRAKQVLETPCDMASMHTLLSKIPENLPFEKLLRKTLELYKSYPPRDVEEEVQQRVAEESKQRAMELSIRQERMNRIRNGQGALLWRWLGRLDPVRRFPIWGFPQPQHVPHAIRQYKFAIATAFAVSVYAFYLQSLEGR